MKKKLFMLAFLGSCTCEGQKASWETQEDARRQAIENSTFVAQRWRTANASNARLIARGDSTINAKCPQGDGWATIDLENDNGAVIKLKCSTVSETMGCLTEDDFKTKTYAQQEGRCNDEIPFPLPKIVK